MWSCYQLFLKSFNTSNILLSKRMKWKHNTETHCKIRQKLYSRYVPIKLLIDNKFRLLFTYNNDFIRYLTSLGSLRTLRFTESVFVGLNKQIVNTRLDRPLKPGIRNKTLRIVLRFQIEISRLMCICWHSFFNRFIFFCVFY